MYLHKTPFLLKALYPSYVWNKNRKEKKVFLTFDDGPIPEITPFVLEQLAKHEAKATFFCVGENIQKYPDVFKTILAHGHAVGNHTFNHLNGWKENNEEYGQNVELCQSEIEKLHKPIGRPLLRPPYGKIKRRQAQHLRKQYDIVMWDVLSGDFDAGLQKEICLRKTIEATQNGSIVVFHDSIKSEKNLRYCLPKFLSHFIGEGFSFETL